MFGYMLQESLLIGEALIAAANLHIYYSINLHFNIRKLFSSLHITE